MARWTQPYHVAVALPQNMNLRNVYEYSIYVWSLPIPVLQRVPPLPHADETMASLARSRASPAPQFVETNDRRQSAASLPHRPRLALQGG